MGDNSVKKQIKKGITFHEGTLLIALSLFTIAGLSAMDPAENQPTENQFDPLYGAVVDLGTYEDLGEIIIHRRSDYISEEEKEDENRKEPPRRKAPKEEVDSSDDSPKKEIDFDSDSEEKKVVKKRRKTSVIDKVKSIKVTSKKATVKDEIEFLSIDDYDSDSDEEFLTGGKKVSPSTIEPLTKQQKKIKSDAAEEKE